MTGCCALALSAGALQARVSRDPELSEALAYVEARCPQDGADVSRSVWQQGWAFNALYGACHSTDGGDRHIWFFVHGRFVGMDTKGHSGGIIGMWRDLRTIAFMYVLYRPSDPECCATGGGKIVRFRWTGRRVEHLEPIPNHRSP